MDVALRSGGHASIRRAEMTAAATVGRVTVAVLGVVPPARAC